MFFMMRVGDWAFECVFGCGPLPVTAIEGLQESLTKHVIILVVTVTEGATPDICLHLNIQAIFDIFVFF